MKVVSAEIHGIGALIPDNAEYSLVIRAGHLESDQLRRLRHTLRQYRVIPADKPAPRHAPDPVRNSVLHAFRTCGLSVEDVDTLAELFDDGLRVERIWRPWPIVAIIAAGSAQRLNRATIGVGHGVAGVSTAAAAVAVLSIGGSVGWELSHPPDAPPAASPGTNRLQQTSAWSTPLGSAAGVPTPVRAPSRPPRAQATAGPTPAHRRAAPPSRPATRPTPTTSATPTGSPLDIQIGGPNGVQVRGDPVHGFSADAAGPNGVAVKIGGNGVQVGVGGPTGLNLRICVQPLRVCSTTLSPPATLPPNPVAPPPAPHS